MAVTTGPAADAPDFELDVEIGVVAEVVRETLADLDRLSPLHPLIESIEALPARSPYPTARWYRVVDRIPFGPWKLKTVYEAALEVVSDVEVHGHAWQSPGVRLLTVYHLTRAGDGTRLRERCSVTAPFGMRRFVVSQARGAHAEMLAGLKRLLEGGAP